MFQIECQDVYSAIFLFGCGLVFQITADRDVDAVIPAYHVAEFQPRYVVRERLVGIRIDGYLPAAKRLEQIDGKVGTGHGREPQFVGEELAENHGGLGRLDYRDRLEAICAIDERQQVQTKEAVPDAPALQ